MADENNLDSKLHQIKLEKEQQHPKSPTSSTTMAEIEQPQSDQTSSPSGGDSPNKKGASISFSIWPPTQRTRDAVINRLIETLSSPSVLSKRYGVVPHDEASDAAKRIEEEAFAAAGASATSDDDGIEILQVYSKEISRRMLDIVKSRSASSDTPPPSVIPEEVAAAGGGGGDDVLSEETTSAVEN